LTVGRQLVDGEQFRKEKILGQILDSVHWNDEIFPTKRTRCRISVDFVLAPFFDAFEAVAVETRQHSGVVEHISADWTFVMSSICCLRDNIAASVIAPKPVTTRT
jgi:hypothetical protein